MCPCTWTKDGVGKSEVSRVCVWAKCERVVRGVPGECRAVLAFHGSPSPTEDFEGTERDSLKLSLW